MRRLALCLLLVPSLAWAGAVRLSWTFPRDFPIDTFVLTLATQRTTDTLSVRPSKAGACGKGDADLYCADLPECPAEGAYEVRVQAQRGNQQSAPATIGCVFTAQGGPCQCLALVTDPTPPPPPVTQVPVVMPTQSPAPASSVPPAVEAAPSAEGFQQQFEAIDAAYQAELRGLMDGYIEALLTSTDMARLDQLTRDYQAAQQRLIETYQGKIKAWQDGVQRWQRDGLERQNPSR